MKALEFKAKIKNNRIQIPLCVQSELETNQERDVRVIVLIDDSVRNDDYLFKQATSKHFIEEYAESDSIYDNHF